MEAADAASFASLWYAFRKASLLHVLPIALQALSHVAPAAPTVHSARKPETRLKSTRLRTQRSIDVNRQDRLCAHEKAFTED